MRRKHSREPQLFDLINFVEDEMTLVNDPLYSRDAVSQYIEKNQKFIGLRIRKGGHKQEIENW